MNNVFDLVEGQSCIILFTHDAPDLRMEKMGCEHFQLMNGNADAGG